jgi:shikimate kinase
MNSSIALVGFVGTGKDEVGRALAERLGVDYVDADATLQAEYGMTPRELLSRLGESGLRNAQAQLVATLTARANSVITLDGEALETRSVREAIAGKCPVVLLTSDLCTAYEKADIMTNHPLAVDEEADPSQSRVIELMHARAHALEPGYSLSVSSDTPIDDTVHAIVSWAKNL